MPPWGEDTIISGAALTPRTALSTGNLRRDGDAELATDYSEYECEPPEVTYLLCTFVEEFSVSIVARHRLLALCYCVAVDLVYEVGRLQHNTTQHSISCNDGGSFKDAIQVFPCTLVKARCKSDQ